MKTTKMNDIKIYLCLLILGCMFSCSSEKASSKQVLRHVVSFQFKEDVTETQKAEAIRIFGDLEDKIPEILKFEGGENFNTEGLSKNFTHCFILTFENEAARDAYIPHPEHLKVVEKNKPLFSDLLVLDVWGEE